MSLGFAQIYGDDVAATHTPPTTAWSGFPGSTAWTGQSHGAVHAKPEPLNTTALSFVTGYEGKGTWHIGYNASFTASAGNKTYHIALFKNGTKIPFVSLERKLGTAGDIGAASASGFIILQPSTDHIEFYVQTESSGTKVTLNHLNFWMEHISTSTRVG